MNKYTTDAIQNTTFEEQWDRKENIFLLTFFMYAFAFLSSCCWEPIPRENGKMKRINAKEVDKEVCVCEENDKITGKNVF